MSLEQQVVELVKASNKLTDTVSGKVSEIDKTVSDAEKSFNTWKGNTDKENANWKGTTKSELTIIATDGYRKAIEHNSGGRNTVIYDEQGNPNIMCVIPRFNMEDLGLPELNLGTGLHPAFITSGAPRGEILIGKYLASSANGGTAVVGGAQPRVSVNYDAAKELCTRKGAGWHMMSIHEWAAIALWSLANDTIPRGNTNYGRAHDAKWETARRADNGLPGDTSGTARTDTGKGPATWNHDHSEFGIADLVGNVWEWIDQMKLVDGQIITTPHNDPLMAEETWRRHQAFLDSATGITEGTGSAGATMLSNKISNRNGPLGDDSHDYPYSTLSHFAAVQKAAEYAPNELLRQLLIESASTTTHPGGIWARNYGTRLPLRGGNWSYGSGAGLGALSLSYARSNSYGYIGFRPAFLGN